MFCLQSHSANRLYNVLSLVFTAKFSFKRPTTLPTVAAPIICSTMYALCGSKSTGFLPPIVRLVFERRLQLKSTLLSIFSPLTEPYTDEGDSPLTVYYLSCWEVLMFRSSVQ